MNKLRQIIENVEGYWIFETFNQHKIILYSQIDVMIREKKRSKKEIYA
ncbi:MAG TPA: hypothetical protein VH500_19890 [Nitrososphaeraceae archaeon]